MRDVLMIPAATSVTVCFWYQRSINSPGLTCKS